MNLKENAFKPISFWSWNGLMEEEKMNPELAEIPAKAPKAKSGKKSAQTTKTNKIQYNIQKRNIEKRKLFTGSYLLAVVYYKQAQLSKRI